MTWPTPQDYNEAIQNPALCFHDADLKAGFIECNALGLPKSASGSFASVYKLTTKDGPWAIRCFLRFLPEQADRYRKISNFVLFDNLDCTVDFYFIEKGIMVRGTWYPILKMKWIHGETLDLYIHKHFQDAEKMAKLAADFYDLVMQLEHADIAHGDLQHGNIIVSSEGLRLVDYDALFVPELAGLRCLEFGHPNYQHPQRSPSHFDPSVDNFSTWLIHASLLAIQKDPGLFKTFAGGDESILFKRKDLLSPETSPLFKSLIEHEDAEIRNTTQILVRMLWTNPCVVPSLNANAYLLSALPNVQPYSTPVVEDSEPAAVSAMAFDQGDSDLHSIISSTIEREVGIVGKFQHRRKKFRFKATAAGLSKSVQANVVKAVNTTFRKSTPRTWTSVMLRAGDRHYLLGEYEEAIQAFMEVQKYREEFLNQNTTELIELQLRLGRTFGMLHNVTMACNYFLMASKTAEQASLSVQQQRARFLLALARYQSGKVEDAFAIINALNDQSVAFNLEAIVKKESPFKYISDSSTGTLKLIENSSINFAEKGDLKKSMAILEIGRGLYYLLFPSSPEFRQSYLDLLFRLGCLYIRGGFFSYANGIAIQAESLANDFVETNSFRRLQIQFFSACVYVKLNSSSSLHPSMIRLACALREETDDLIESVVKTFYKDFGEKSILAVLATSASYLNDHHVQMKAVGIAKLAWRLLLRDWDSSLISKIRWLENIEQSLLHHCLDEETTKWIVGYVGNNIKNTKSLDDTEFTLAALRKLGDASEQVTLAVLDEMIRLVKKYDLLFSIRQVTLAKTLLQQYDFSKIRIRLLDDIDGIS